MVRVEINRVSGVNVSCTVYGLSMTGMNQKIHLGDLSPGLWAWPVQQPQPGLRQRGLQQPLRVEQWGLGSALQV